MASPPILNLLENVTFPDRLAEMRAFFSGAAAKNPGFRVFIDSACALPSNWQDTWAAPKQWGVTGNQHWATKYGAQGFIPKMLANSPYATNDWRSASASVVVLFARHFGGGPAIVQQQCLQRLRERSAAFIATNGSRHFFIFTDSRGPCCLDGKYKDVDFIHHHIIVAVGATNATKDRVINHHYSDTSPPVADALSSAPIAKLRGEGAAKKNYGFS